ncbi:MAG: glycosyltransferase family 39 protein [Candidatus Melainabacteria bacterium]|nr:glycosyltransferase family 39 protein [Candidatus Melainabacteria bacterium]
MRFKIDYLFYLFLVLFLITSFLIVDDFGVPIDNPKNYFEGEANLTYLLTGDIESSKVLNQTHGAFIFMLADASRRLLSNKLHFLNPIAARHIVLPLITALFFIPLFYFLKKYFSSGFALAVIAILVTYPEYFGHIFNNLKDPPLVVFFTLAIISYAEWIFSKKLKYLYLFFVFFGLALCIKLYALLLIVILFLWIKLGGKRFVDKNCSLKKNHFHFLIGFLIILTLLALLYNPTYWGWGIENKILFIKRFISNIRWITSNSSANAGLTLYPFVQVFYRTPLLMLLCFTFGFYQTVAKHKTDLSVLLIVWCLIPVVILCFQQLYRYHNGSRLFLVYVVPFSIVSVIGIQSLVSLLVREFKLDETSLKLIIPVLVFSLNLSSIISTHPYQTTYFNSLARGLKGAQEKHIPNANDYWFNSYRKAGKWLDKNAKKNSNIFFINRISSRTYLIEDLISRKDLLIRNFFPQRIKYIFPHDSYIVIIPFDSIQRGHYSSFWKENYKIVHEIKRQGGEILTIYYKP